MTRDEWVQRYVIAMRAGGSALPEQHLIARAEAGCDATEQAGGIDHDLWEAPEAVAEEDLDADGNQDNCAAIFAHAKQENSPPRAALENRD